MMKVCRLRRRLLSGSDYPGCRRAEGTQREHEGQRQFHVCIRGHNSCARRWKKAEVSLVVGAHPAMHSVAAQAAAIQVRRLDSFKRIRRQGFAFGLYIYLVKPRGVQPEDLRLILFSELLVA